MRRSTLERELTKRRSAIFSAVIINVVPTNEYLQELLDEVPVSLSPTSAFLGVQSSLSPSSEFLTCLLSKRMDFFPSYVLLFSSHCQSDISFYYCSSSFYRAVAEVFWDVSHWCLHVVGCRLRVPWGNVVRPFPSLYLADHLVDCEFMQTIGLTLACATRFFPHFFVRFVAFACIFLHFVCSFFLASGDKVYWAGQDHLCN